jgi:hypothetical protein
MGTFQCASAYAFVHTQKPRREKEVRLCRTGVPEDIVPTVIFPSPRVKNQATCGKTRAPKILIN